jgi:hypothetical protein
LSFRVSDPQIYEFTICFTFQSPISGLNKLNRSNNRQITPPISGNDVISNLLHNQMILTPIAIDAHCTLTSRTHDPSIFLRHTSARYLHVKNLSPTDQMQKLCMIEQPPYQPLLAYSYSLRLINDGNNFKQTIPNIIKNSTDLAITLQHLPYYNPTTRFRNYSRIQYPHHLNSFKKLFHL